MQHYYFTFKFNSKSRLSIFDRKLNREKYRDFELTFNIHSNAVFTTSFTKVFFQFFIVILKAISIADLRKFKYNVHKIFYNIPS